MSSLSQFLGNFPASTTQIVNAFSSNGWSGIGTISPALNSVAVVSGVLTANTLATVLNLTGKGELTYFDNLTGDATARTMRVQIVCDGVTVLDSTSASISTNGTGMFLGMDLPSGFLTMPETPTYFNKTLTVKIASSLSETGKFTSHYIYHLHA